MDLSTFFERLPLATYRLSMCAEVLYINAEFARLHGYSAPPELLLQLDSHTLNCFASPQQGAEFHNQLLATGTVRNFITQWIRHRTGDLLWVRMNAHLVRDANQTPHCYEGTAEDISAEHARNIAQREHETMLFNLLQAIPDQIWLKSLYGSYLACNQHFAQTLGRPAADIIGTVDADYPCAAMASHYFVSDETVIRTGKYASYEVEVRTSNDLGSDTFEIIKAPVRNASGTVTGVLGMARNISLRKYSEARLRDATEHLQMTLAAADLGRWDYDLISTRGFHLDTLAWNMLGYPASPYERGTQLEELLHPDDLPDTLRAMHWHLEGRRPAFSIEFRARHQNGEWVWLSCRGKIVKVRADGSPLKMAGTLMDISERKHVEHALRAARSALQATLDALPDMLFELTPQGVFRAIHCMDHSLLPMPPDNLLGKSVGDVLPTEAAAAYQHALHEAFTAGRSKGRQYSLVIGGETHWFDISAVRKPTDPGEEGRVMAIARDITESKATGDSIAHLAFHDTLTGLPNRRLLTERLQRAISSCTRTRHYGALLFIDLDGFKQLNDTYGHDVGDQVLKGVANRLLKTVREIDSVARLGGDEFVVAVSNLHMEGAQARKQAETLGRKILQRLGQGHHIGKIICTVTPSIGITLFHDDELPHDALLRQADAAMYVAKANGRNTLRFFDNS